MRFKYIVTYGILHIIYSSLKIHSVVPSFSQLESPLNYDILDILEHVANSHKHIAHKNVTQNCKSINLLNETKVPKYMKIRYGPESGLHASYEYTVSLLSSVIEETNKNNESAVEKNTTTIRREEYWKKNPDNSPRGILSPQLTELNAD